MAVLLRDKAYQLIKQKIVTLEYDFGQQLVAGTVSADVGIGRTPVREALQKLAEERLVIIIPRRGMYVSTISAWELARLIEVRTMLEVFCTRRAAERASEGELEELRRFFVGAERLARERRHVELLRADRRFHERIVAILDNPFLTEQAARVYDQLARTWFLSFRRRSRAEVLSTIQEHRAIIAALGQHSPEAAERAVLAHLEQYRRRVMD